MITADTIPTNSSEARIVYESYVRPSLNARRVQISAASVTGWIAIRHGLDWEDARRVMQIIQNVRPGIFHERDIGEVA